jgi:hypothetical protein
MTPEERALLIERYAKGPQALRNAYESAPEEMRQWRPAPDAWSVHEIICHCADSEMGGALRIRILAAEPDPLIIGYDQDAWTRIFDYHNRSTELAFGVIDAVRSWTSALLPTLIGEQWGKVGTHSESGTYSATDWLHTYGNHLHEHVDQIKANIDAWRAQPQT